MTVYSSPVPENRENMSPVRDEDGDQDNEIIPLSTYDELVGVFR